MSHQPEQVVEIPLKNIDMGDHTYMFRQQIRAKLLVESVKADGIQLPVVVRPRDGERFQLVAGFRRCTAAGEAGLPSVPAIVRELTDEQALDLCVIENSQRSSYTPLAKARAALALRRAGRQDEQIWRMMGVKGRQLRNLLGLLEMEPDIQAAVDDAEQSFTHTHAIRLRELRSRFRQFDAALRTAKNRRRWISVVNDESLSVQQLTRRVSSEYGKSRSEFTGLLHAGGTDSSAGTFRLLPIKFSVEHLNQGERQTLREQLKQVLAALDQADQPNDE